jgi:hypothetical protein
LIRFTVWSPDWIVLGWIMDLVCNYLLDLIVRTCL